MLAIVEGQSWGWGSATFVLVLLAAAILLATFLWRCEHHPSPIVELSLLRLRPFAVANATMLAFYVGFGAMLLGAVLFLTGVWHESTVVAGLEIAPGPLVVALLSSHVKRLVARFGAWAVTVTGALLLAVAGAWWAWRLGADPTSRVAFLPGMLIAGLGVALTQATLYGVVAVAPPPHRFATGSGVLNMCRQISLALGVAVLVAILGTSPDVAAFHRGFELVAIGGVAAALLAALLPARAGAVAAVQPAARGDHVDRAAVAGGLPRPLMAVRGGPPRRA